MTAPHLPGGGEEADANDAKVPLGDGIESSLSPNALAAPTALLELCKVVGVAAVLAVMSSWTQRYGVTALRWQRWLDHRGGVGKGAAGGDGTGAAGLVHVADPTAVTVFRSAASSLRAAAGAAISAWLQSQAPLPTLSGATTGAVGNQKRKATKPVAHVGESETANRLAQGVAALVDLLRTLQETACSWSAADGGSIGTTSAKRRRALNGAKGSNAKRRGRASPRRSTCTTSSSSDGSSTSDSTSSSDDSSSSGDSSSSDDSSGSSTSAGSHAPPLPKPAVARAGASGRGRGGGRDRSTR